MRIEIEIPKEFEKHFNNDKFKDSFERIMADIKHSLENGDCLCAGRYEYETIEMLENAFENSKPAYSVDKVVDELESELEKGNIAIDFGEFRLFEIVKQCGVSDDVCEWKQTSTSKYKTECGYKLEEYFDTKACYCKQCGKKIKQVSEGNNSEPDIDKLRENYQKAEESISRIKNLSG